MPHQSFAELWTFARSRHTWLIPAVLIAILAVIFPLVYLSATSSPQDDLRGLPVALVVESVPSAGNGVSPLAEQLATAISAAVDADKIALTPMSGSELDEAMADDRVAGAIVIPADYDSSVAEVIAGPSASTQLPRVQILTNAADGGISGGLVTSNVVPVLEGVRAALGGNLMAQVEASGQGVDGAQSMVLSSPFTIASAPFAELPENAGFGMSAFYYALALVLLGFVGASVINPSIDSALGFAPAEMGPLVARRPYRRMSRLHTLLVKWGILVGIAPVASALVLLTANVVGVSSPEWFGLWLFGAVATAAVGIGALAVFAIFGGGIGALVNTTFFIALAMTSSGGTVPLVATPPLFAWLSQVSPFHAVMDGTRALLYFGGNPDAGLADGWLHAGIGLAVAVVLGVTVTSLYARQRMFTRHPRQDATVSAGQAGTAPSNALPGVTSA